MAGQSSAPATHGFWIVSGVFLVWNLLGVMAFVMQVTMSEEALAALPEAERNLYLGTPVWATAAYAVAVFGGTLGCVFLLLRKSWAISALIASLAGVVVQMSHAFFLTPALDVLGPGSVVMPIVILAGAIFLVWYARRARNKNLIG